MPAGVPSPPGTRTESLNDRLGLEHLKQRADLHQRQEQEANDLQTLRQNALETVEKSCLNHAATIAVLSSSSLRRRPKSRPSDQFTGCHEAPRVSRSISANLTLISTLPGVQAGSNLTKQFGESLTFPLALEFPMQRACSSGPRIQEERGRNASSAP